MNLPPPPPSFRLNAPIDVNALLEEPEPEHNWLVPGLLERSDRVIFTGGEGEGKSLLHRQMAIQIALGISPFTLEPMRPCRVWLADMENPREAIKTEIRKICESAGVSPPEPGWLTVANWEAGVDLTDPRWEQSIRYELLQSPPDILFAGPLYKLAGDDLSNEAVSRPLSAALDRLRVEFGFALILEAHQINEQVAFDPKARHFRKNREARPYGSSLWRRWPEIGRCLFTDGTLWAWRNDRVERNWPKKLQRGDTWLWELQAEVCLRVGCENPLTGKQERYCSELCSHAARQQNYRQRAKVTAD